MSSNEYLIFFKKYATMGNGGNAIPKDIASPSKKIARHYMKTAIKQTLSPTKGKEAVKGIFSDIATAVIAGIIVGFAYFFFQNSNGFAPGGVGGLATMTYHFLGSNFPWAVLMLLFNIPIFVLVSIFVNRKLEYLVKI